MRLHHPFSAFLQRHKHGAAKQAPYSLHLCAQAYARITPMHPTLQWGARTWSIKTGVHNQTHHYHRAPRVLRSWWSNALNGRFLGMLLSC